MKTLCFALPARTLPALEKQLLVLLGGVPAAGRGGARAAELPGAEAADFTGPGALAEAVWAVVPEGAAEADELPGDAAGLPAEAEAGGLAARLRRAAGEALSVLRERARHYAPGGRTHGREPGARDGVPVGEAGDAYGVGDDWAAGGASGEGADRESSASGLDELRQRLAEAEAAAKRAFLLANAASVPGVPAYYSAGGGAAGQGFGPRAALPGERALYGAGAGLGAPADGGSGPAEDIFRIPGGGSAGGYAQGARLPGALSTDMQAVSDYFRRASRCYDGGYTRY